MSPNTAVIEQIETQRGAKAYFSVAGAMGMIETASTWPALLESDASTTLLGHGYNSTTLEQIAHLV